MCSSDLKKIIGLILLFIGGFTLAQGDLCSSASNLGSLPTPGSCTGGVQTGATLSQNGTTVGATAANPYVYQTGCQGQGGNMDFPANDVWYSFTASGTVLNLDISSLSNANVALWNGRCGN